MRLSRYSYSWCLHRLGGIHERASRRHHASGRPFAGGTIDPHINYTLQYWQIYQSLYDGLVAFQKAAGADGFTKVPDIAEAFPEPTNDGKTYVFKIRKGIMFSNGKELV